MKIIKTILITLVALVVLVIAVGFALPDSYKVERSLTMAAPADKIYPLIADPKAWARWSIWNQRDPAMKMEYSGAASGVGAKWSWDSKSEGKGQMEFTRAEAPGLIEYKLYFPDFDSSSSGRIALTPDGAGTKVSWSNAGSFGANPLLHYFAIMMDRMVGPDFEGGLNNLKALAEKS